MNQDNKKVMRRLIEELEGGGNFGLAEELVAADYAGHTPFGELEGREDYVRTERMLRSAFPDMEVRMTHELYDGDMAAVRLAVCATNTGPFLGLPPTGKPIEITGAALYRIAGGKIVEGWSHPDMLSLMQQLGAAPQPEGI
jgi:predicted ester cyclase